MVECSGVRGRAPLRGADWRFLLPLPEEGQFQHLVLIGGPDGLAERIIEIGFARRVSDTIPRERSADAVAVLQGARAAPAEIAGCLAPGGVLYHEIDRRGVGLLTSTPGRIRESLRKVGLTPGATYAVSPDFSDHRLYLPLDVPGALRWYVTTLHNAFAPWQHLQVAGLRVVTNLDGRRLAAVAPRLAVTAVFRQTRPGAPSVLQHRALPPELQGYDLHPLLLTAGGDRVVMLPFAPGSAQPLAVLKVPRLPGFNGRTENEQAILANLWSRLDPTIRSSVPRPLGMLRFGEVTVGIESYVPGELLSRSTERWGGSPDEKLSDLRAPAAWLADFHVQMLVGRPSWGAAEQSRWVEQPFEAYRRTFGLTTGEERLFAAALEHTTSLVGSPLPIVLQHRDFTVWNIARSGRDLAVLDWEGGRPGPALCDLLHFVTHWYEAVHRAHDEEARQRCFRRLLFKPNPDDLFGKAVHEVIARYMTRLEIAPCFLPLLLVYTWVELALRRADQQRVLEESSGGSRKGNRSVAFVAILAEHAGRLFAEDLWLGGRPDHG